MSDPRPAYGTKPTKLKALVLPLRWQCQDCNAGNWQHYLWCASCGYVRPAANRLAVALVAACLALPASAQPATECVPLAQLRDHLAEKYDEHPVWVGKAPGGGGLILVMGAGDGKTWTIVAVKDNVACPLYEGKDWSIAPAMGRKS